MNPKQGGSLILTSFIVDAGRMLSPQEDPLWIKSEKVTNKPKLKTCPHCGKTLNGINGNYRKHIRSIHGNKEFPCERCEQKFNRPDNLKRHIEATHDFIRYKCNYCQALYSERKPLQKHSKKEHPEEEIIYEKIKIDPKSEWWAKINGAKEPTSKFCPECGKSFYKLVRHMRSVHGEKTWACEHCNAKFTVKDNLQRHERTVHLGELLKCHFCPYKATVKKSVMKHAKKKHPLEDLDRMKLVKVIDKQWTGNENVSLNEEKERKEYLLNFINKRSHQKWRNHDAIIERFKALSNL